MADWVSISFLRAAPNTPVADDSVGASEMLTPSGANAVSAVESTADLSILRIASTQSVIVALGAAPDATSDADRFLLPAGQTEWRGVRSGRKVAVVLA